MTALARPAPRVLGDFAAQNLERADGDAATIDGGGSEPEWLAEVRRDAWTWIETHGFPTRKHEDWRYVPLGPVLAEAFDPVSPALASGALSESDVAAHSADLGGNRLVFVNGRYAPELSRLVSPAGGGWIGDLGSALGTGDDRAGDDRARDLFSGPPSSANLHRHAFSALNAALANDGAVVDLPAGAVIDEPIELLFLTVPGVVPFLSSPRSHLRFGEGSRATIVETHAAIEGAGARHLTNARSAFDLGEGAQVELYVVQDEPDDAFHFSSRDVHLGSNSRFTSRLVALGAAVARHEVRVVLDGPGAQAILDGLYLPRANQHHDQPILVDHASPGCTSAQRYVGIIDDHAHGVFNGHVVVRPGAIGTDASQSNRNLLLSDQAEADTRPRLEIFTDDVLCAHGASVGRLDADALFYLRSRGIPDAEARGILVEGFARQMIDRLELEPVRTRVEELIKGRLFPGAPPGVADRVLTEPVVTEPVVTEEPSEVR